MSTKEKEKEENVIERIKEKGLVSIKSLVAQDDPASIGLENYGLVVFPSAVHSEPMRYDIIGGRKIYVTGLNENHDSVLSISDPKAKAAKIKMIRETVAYMEKIVHYHELDPTADNFWDLVKTFRADNEEYYGKIRVNFSNDEQFLFPETDIDHLVLYHSLNAKGFSMCSPDIQICRKEGTKWFLSVERDFEKIEISSARLVNRAIASLETLFEEDNNKIFYMVKVLVADAAKFRITSSRDAMYTTLDDFIRGKKQETKIAKAVDSFKTALGYKEEELIVRALVSDAYYYRVFRNNKDSVVDYESGENLGSNTEEVVQYLLNPLNQEFYSRVLAVFREKYW